MGRQIMRLSRKSTRSFYWLYSRFLTLVFALFCTVTGQVQKSAVLPPSSSPVPTFKGTLYSASDSSLLKNVQFYLQNCITVKYGIMPEYGVIKPLYGISAYYGVNTGLPPPAKTNEKGQFDIALNSSPDLQYTISTDEVVEPSSKPVYYTSGCFTIKTGVDTTYTLYLDKQTTAVAPARADTKHQFTLSAIRGNDFRFQIPEWKGQRITASIHNSSGRKIARLDADPDGALRWDTRSITGGIYFLSVKNNKNSLSMKILVK